MKGQAKTGAAPMVKTTIRVPQPLWRAARIRALDEQISFQELIERTLEMYLKGKPKQPKGGA